MRGENLTRHNVHRIFAASALISFKINFDNDPGLLSYMSKVLEIEAKILIKLERIFCQGINFDMYISHNT
jgi:hypothetical protein